jgi:hypothetical protein
MGIALPYRTPVPVFRNTTDRATHLVASVPLLAQLRLETAAKTQALWRVWAGPTGQTHSFDCIAEEGVFVKAWRGKTAHHV